MDKETKVMNVRDLARDPELNRLWIDLLKGEEKNLEDDELYELSKKINQHLQKLTKRQNIDITEEIYQSNSMLDEIVETFLTTDSYICQDCGTVFYHDDDGNDVHVKSFTSKIVVETEKKKKIGRNDPCPCGSGKKYKKCCLKL